jgi:hypothetical protein
VRHLQPRPAPSAWPAACAWRARPPDQGTTQAPVNMVTRPSTYHLHGLPSWTATRPQPQAVAEPRTHQPAQLLTAPGPTFFMKRVCTDREKERPVSTGRFDQCCTCNSGKIQGARAAYLLRTVPVVVPCTYVQRSDRPQRETGVELAGHTRTFHASQAHPPLSNQRFIVRG